MEKNTDRNINYSKIEEILIEHKELLEQKDFKEESNVQKLRFLNKALESHNEDEVFEKWRLLTFREFKDYTEGKEDKRLSPESQSYKPKRKQQHSEQKSPEPISNPTDGHNKTSQRESIIE